MGPYDKEKLLWWDIRAIFLIHLSFFEFLLADCCQDPTLHIHSETHLAFKYISETHSLILNCYVSGKVKAGIHLNVKKIGKRRLQQMLKDLTKEEFDRSINNSDKSVVLKFKADPWSTCQQLAPVVSDVSEQMGDQAEFYSVDVQNQEELAQQFNIQSIPALVLLKNGEEVDRMTGMVSEQEIKDFASQ